MTVIEGKYAYPYITVFKKEPFQSFLTVKKQDIGLFYFSQYEKVLEFLNYFTENLFFIQSLNLEDIYWYLLLKKYLNVTIEPGIKAKIYDFIKGCEIDKDGKLGFKFSLHKEQKQPDIWSTYLAISNLYLLGDLSLYLKTKGEGIVLTQIKDFISLLDKGDKFIHCLEKDCEICKKNLSYKTLYYVLEILFLLNLEVREHKSKFSSYLKDLKKDPSIIFKLLSLKFLDLDLNIDEKFLHYLLDFQKDNGGFSFKTVNGKVNTTFWITYVLNNYIWLMDYNPSGIYSFINLHLNQILKDKSSCSSKRLIEVSKLIIILSIIWDKLIEEIESVLFKQIEENRYIDIKQLKNSFGLSEGIEEIVSYINLNYSFNLKILDNNIEFKNYLRSLTPGDKFLASEVFNQSQKKSIISLTNIMNKYNMKYNKAQIKIKDFIPIIKKMIENHLLKGEIKTKKKYLFVTKYYFYLDFVLEKIIISDMAIKCEQLFEEKKIIEDIKNDIYNMTLKLKTTVSQIKEEIESYLLINEIKIAKDRLKFITRNALMESDFLNENIENSFNEELYYINIQATLRSEITNWHKTYSVLSKRINNIELQLKEKISEREEISKFDNILDELDNKLSNLENYFNKEIDSFRIFLTTTLEDGYNSEKFNLIVEEFNKIIKSMAKFDSVIYNVSQQITKKEESLLKKHKQLISYWIGIKEDLDKVINFYSEGLLFFKEKIKLTEKILDEVKYELLAINEKAQEKVRTNDFQNAFEIIKKESGILLEKNLEEIKTLHKEVKKEIKSKHKLYILFRFLQEKIEELEEKIIEIISKGTYSLKEKLVEERNRVKIEEFDNFVSEKISLIRKGLTDYKIQLEHTIKTSKLDIQDVIKGFDDILNEFEEFNSIYLKKLNKNQDIIEKIDEKSNLTVMQWERFREYVRNEITNLKEEYINEILSVKILFIAENKGSNYVNIKELARKLNIKCKEASDRIREMIEISRLNGEINEDDKFVLIFTNYYYKNKELRNFIYNQIIKYNNETIGKTLSLYDSCIKNRTLGINMLELSNRINELEDFDEKMQERFENKVKELIIDIESRKEFKETKDYFRNIIDDSKSGIENIKNNLNQFKSLQNLVNIEYNNLTIDFSQKFQKIEEDLDKLDTFEKMNAYFESIKVKLEEKIKERQEKLEIKLKDSIEKNSETIKLNPEIREFFVKKKNIFLHDYDEKIRNINYKISRKKNEILQGELLDFINNSKIQLNQLLGVLQTRIEDDVEVKEFKRATNNIDKRITNIKVLLKINKRNLKDLIRDISRQAKDFETKNKYILDDFNQYLIEYKSILLEKAKTLERYILRSFIEMAIKAVSNEYLTLGFMNKEIAIKKQNIQDHLLTLISQDKLKGKYDPRLGLYYENPDVIENLDETELEVMKKMNYKVYMFMNRLKNFTSHYYSIIGFFASMFTLSYYLLLFSGWNLAVLIIPILIIIVLFYYLFTRRKEKKMDI